MVDALKSALALLPADSFVESTVAELETFAKLETPVGCLDKASAWGNEVGDSMLVTQLQSAKLVVDAARSIASAELSLRRARDALARAGAQGEAHLFTAGRDLQ